MLKLFKKKKGVEAGWGMVIGIIILVASAMVILYLAKISANKSDEKTGIGLCRASNEVRVGSETAQGYQWWNPVHILTPKICDTIYKTDGSLEVPTEKYSQDKNGAQDEIGDMIKNCWYMWLEGSRGEVFPRSGLFNWFGGEGCHVCYVFKIKGEAGGFGYNDLLASLNKRVYSAKDSSDGCVPNGGFLRTMCSADEKELRSRKADSDPQNRKCCIKSDYLNVCENKGGRCSDEQGRSPGGGYIYKYNKWSCPQPSQVCYVTAENYMTYFKYITEGGRRGGSISSQEDNPDAFATNIAAVSIYSSKGDETGRAHIKVTTLDFATSKEGCTIS